MRGSAEAVVVVSYRWECRGVKGVRAAGCSAEAVVVVSYRHHHPCTDTTTHESAPPMSGKLAHYGAIPTEELYKNFQEVVQPGDGACLFHSIAHALAILCDTNKTADELRKEAVNYVHNNWADFNSQVGLSPSGSSLDANGFRMCFWGGSGGSSWGLEKPGPSYIPSYTFIVSFNITC